MQILWLFAFFIHLQVLFSTRIILGIIFEFAVNLFLIFRPRFFQIYWLIRVDLYGEWIYFAVHGSLTIIFESHGTLQIFFRIHDFILNTLPKFIDLLVQSVVFDRHISVTFFLLEIGMVQNFFSRRPLLGVLFKHGL